MRRAYRMEAAAARLKSTKPTHQDSRTMWNSTHKMLLDCIGKRITLDSIMKIYSSKIGSGALITDHWARVRAISTFLRQPWQVTERLSADRRTTLDIVPMYIIMLIKHCDNNKVRLNQKDCTLTRKRMKEKLENYKKRLLQEPATIRAYLNSLVPKPTDPIELNTLLKLIWRTIYRRYPSQLQNKVAVKKTRQTVQNFPLFRRRSSRKPAVWQAAR